ncbi:dihydropteroate synthase [Catellatospora coxensis]
MPRPPRGGLGRHRRGEVLPEGGEVHADVELERVLPVVRATAERHPHLVISVDTFRADVAQACLDAGAHVVNDTTGLHDPTLADLVAQRAHTQLIVTHSRARPRTHFPRPQYADVAGEIAEFLRSRVAVALERGVRPDQIVIDPGHDLNKNTFHTLELTRRLPEIAAVGYPMLAAVSNKDFVGETLDRPQGSGCPAASPPRWPRSCSGPGSCACTTCASPWTRYA